MSFLSKIQATYRVTASKYATLYPAGWMGEKSNKEWGIYLFKCDQNGVVTGSDPIETIYAASEKNASQAAEKKAKALGYQLVEWPENQDSPL